MTPSRKIHAKLARSKAPVKNVAKRLAVAMTMKPASILSVCENQYFCLFLVNTLLYNVVRVSTDESRTFFFDEFG